MYIDGRSLRQDLFSSTIIKMCPIVTYGALSNSGVAGEPEMQNRR